MFTKLRLWSSEFTTPFAEAVKEAFRVMLFAIPGQIILWIEDKNGSYKVLFVGIILIFLRALDKYLYEKSKNAGLKGDDVVGGLLPI